MANDTLTQPLFESAQDLQLLQRIRVNTPVRQDFVDVDYADWTEVAGNGSVTDVALMGPFEGTGLVITTDGMGNNTIARSAAGFPTIAIPALETHGLVGVYARCDDWTHLNQISFYIYQDAGAWMHYAWLAPMSAYDTFRTNDTWHWLPLIRQTFPDVSTIAYDWDVANNALAVVVSDTGTPITVTLGPWFYLSTAWGPRGGISFFFDKGLASARRSIYYALDHGVGCSIAVIPEKVGTRGYLSLADLRTFYLAGCEICATTSRDLTKLSRQERLAELARTKRWLYSHNFVNGADMFVYPDGEGHSGFFDAWTMFDVMRLFTCARTTQWLPGTTTPVYPYTLPCARVTTQNAATLGGYVTYSMATPASCQFFAWRGFDSDPLDPSSYTFANFCTFVDTYCSDVKSCPPLAMVSQPGCGAPDLSIEDIEGPLKLVVDDANNTSVVDVLEITHSTTGTAGNGIGTGFEFKSEDASGNLDTAGRINCLFPNATHATQTGRMDLCALNAAAGTGITIANTGNVTVGAGLTAGDGTLHVHTATAGAATANTNYNDLVIENSAIAGLSFLTPNTEGAFIVWGDPDDDDIGQIGYSHVSDAMSFTVGATAKAYLTTTGLGLNTNAPTQLLALTYGDICFTPVTAPGAPTVAVSAGGSVDDGAHYYKITFLTTATLGDAVGDQTELGTTSLVATCGGGNNTVNLTAIPLGAAGTGVVRRAIYRTKAGGSTYFYVATLTDNTTTVYADAATDASLGTVEYTSRTNSTAGTFYVGTVRAGQVGINATRFGYNAGANSTAQLCTSIGHYAGYSNTGANSTLLGYQAGYSNTGAYSTLLGYQAGYSNTGAYSTLVGYAAGYSNTGAYSTLLGYAAGYSNTGANSTLVGHYAGYSKFSGVGTTFVGTNADQLVPAAITTATAVAGVNLGIGAYRYRVAFLLDGAYTGLSEYKSVTTTAGNQAVNLAGIPLYVGPKTCTGRRLYRTIVAGTAPLFLADIGDNTTTVYADTTADGGLGAAPDDPDYTIALGYDAKTIKTSQFVVGSVTAPITEMYLGEGVYSVSPQATTFAATGGSGTDIAGAALTIAGGKGSGAGLGGIVVISTSPAGGAGTAENAWVERFRATPAGNIGLFTLTNPGVAATTNGVGVLHLANATTAPVGALTGGGALLYAIAGEMHVFDAAGNDTPFSPHDENGEWQFFSTNTRTGVTKRIRMERFIRAMERLAGESFIEEFTESVAA
jgi:hypothetical protein